MMPFLTPELAEEHIEQLRREAQRERMVRQAGASNRRDNDCSSGSVEPGSVELLQPKPLLGQPAARKARKARKAA
jgi:hypothetical protein